MRPSVIYSTAVLLLNSLSDALPAENGSLMRRDPVPADSIDKYTVQYLLSKVKTPPTLSSCIFYTQGLSTTAFDYAKANTKFTVWNVWDCAFYSRDQIDSNPLREILKLGPDKKDTPVTRTYFERMSEAFATLCKGTAYLMTTNTKQIDETGIWGKTEMPTLKRDNGPCTAIEVCNVKMADCRVPIWWERGRTPKREVVDEPISPTFEIIEEPDALELEKRQTANCPLCAALPNICFTSEELGRLYGDLDKYW